MADIKLALKIRNAVKSRKPKYKRVQSRQFPKLSFPKWRRPKGMGNKVRRGRRGKPSMPQVGFGSPKEAHGLSKKGLSEVIISNPKDLESINPKTQVAVIKRTVGKKRKLEILKRAKELSLNISNIKDIEKAIKDLTKAPKEKKDKKAKAKEEKKSETASDNKAEEKEEEKKPESKSDDKAKEEKKEEVKSDDKTKKKEEESDKKSQEAEK